METNRHPNGKSVESKQYQDLEFEDFVANDSDDTLENKSLSQIEEEYYNRKENPRDTDEIRNWDNT